MDKKYIIGAVIAIILVLIGGALLMGGGSHERGPGEIVVAAYSHGGEKLVSIQLQVGTIMQSH